MHRYLFALLFALVVPLAAPGPLALAAPFTPTLDADYAFAEAFWQGRQPTGCATVTREVVAAGSLGEHVLGRATRPEPDAEPIPCSMAIDEAALAEPDCSTREVVAHEYGHLLGEGHSEDPASIMYPTMTGVFCPPKPAVEAPPPAAAPPPPEDATGYGTLAYQQNWEREVEMAIIHQLRRCAHKTKPVQVRWCAVQMRSWRKLAKHPPPVFR